MTLEQSRQRLSQRADFNASIRDSQSAFIEEMVALNRFGHPLNPVSPPSEARFRRQLREVFNARTTDERSRLLSELGGPRGTFQIPDLTPRITLFLQDLQARILLTDSTHPLLTYEREHGGFSQSLLNEALNFSPRVPEQPAHVWRRTINTILARPPLPPDRAGVAAVPGLPRDRGVLLQRDLRELLEAPMVQKEGLVRQFINQYGRYVPNLEQTLRGYIAYHPAPVDRWNESNPREPIPVAPAVVQESPAQPPVLSHDDIVPQMRQTQQPSAQPQIQTQQPPQQNNIVTFPTGQPFQPMTMEDYQSLEARRSAIRGEVMAEEMRRNIAEVKQQQQNLMQMMALFAGNSQTAQMLANFPGINGLNPVTTISTRGHTTQDAASREPLTQPAHQSQPPETPPEGGESPEVPPPLRAAREMAAAHETMIAKHSINVATLMKDKEFGKRITPEDLNRLQGANRTRENILRAGRYVTSLSIGAGVALLPSIGMAMSITSAPVIIPAIAGSLGYFGATRAFRGWRKRDEAVRALRTMDKRAGEAILAGRDYTDATAGDVLRREKRVNGWKSAIANLVGLPLAAGIGAAAGTAGVLYGSHTLQTTTAPAFYNKAVEQISTDYNRIHDGIVSLYGALKSALHIP